MSKAEEKIAKCTKNDRFWKMWITFKKVANILSTFRKSKKRGKMNLYTKLFTFSTKNNVDFT